MADHSPQNRAKTLLRRIVIAIMGALPTPVLFAIRDRGLKWRRRRLWIRMVKMFFHHWPIERLGSFTVPGEDSIQLVAADTFLIQRLFWLGREGYEPLEAARWQAACIDASHVVELGANIGWYAVLGARANPAARYVAVEPQPFAVSVLRQNLELNAIANVEVVEAAVVATEEPGGTIQLHFPDATLHNPAPGRAFVTGAEFQLLEAHTSLDVPTVGAASTCAGADLIKLDIEGLEADVLAAAEAEITASRPRIFVETQPEATRLAELIGRWERDHGYRVNPLGRYDLILEPQ